MTRDARSAQRVAEKRKKRERLVREEKAKRKAGQVQSGVKRGAERAGDLPIVECVISKGWQERGLAHILLVRREREKRVTAAGYYVDLLCLGLKSTALLPNMEEEEYRRSIKPNVFTDPVEFENCLPSVAKAVVLGSIEFAEKYGFRPNKRWPQTKYFLEGIEADFDSVTFGRDGNPCLVVRRNESAAGAIARLERTAGPGNYTVVEAPSEG